MTTESYFLIYEWMAEKLDLKGSDLVVFAMIYSFCNFSDKCFPSQEYIAKFTGFSRRTVMRSINYLCERKLIEKTRSANKFNQYRLCDKMALEHVTNCHIAGDKMSHNNIVDNIDDNTTTYNTTRNSKYSNRKDEEWGYSY